MKTNSDTTLRLVFPQWQGGANPAYHLGSQPLAWLAPAPDGPVEHVAVPEPDGRTLEVEDGIVARAALLAQMREARRLIDGHSPDRLLVLGGDCLVDLAPFAYLNERYDGDLAVLWVDAHPDVMTPKEFRNAHAMVLGNLLGEGDADFAGAVERPLDPANVMYAGLRDMTAMENAFVAEHGLVHAGPTELAEGSGPVLDWFRSTGAKHLAIHLDLDVLDPHAFRAVLFADPDASAGTFDGVAQGAMSMYTVTRLLCDVAGIADVVGFGITEHMPWEAIALRKMLARLPLPGVRRG